jgi:hypothetical protein
VLGNERPDFVPELTAIVLDLPRAPGNKELVGRLLWKLDADFQDLDALKAWAARHDEPLTAAYVMNKQGDPVGAYKFLRNGLGESWDPWKVAIMTNLLAGKAGPQDEEKRLMVLDLFLKRVEKKLDQPDPYAFIDILRTVLDQCHSQEALRELQDSITMAMDMLDVKSHLTGLRTRLDYEDLMARAVSILVNTPAEMGSQDLGIMAEFLNTRLRMPADRASKYRLDVAMGLLATGRLTHPDTLKTARDMLDNVDPTAVDPDELAEARAMLAAGATRIGASAGVKIVQNG